MSFLQFRKVLRRASAFQWITFSFLAVILAGSLLLYLPVAAAGGRQCSYLDALFTSCSAVCVTGLVVQNTGTFWSAFGRAVILLLIQIGGLGVITMVITGSIITGKRIGLRQRNLMQNAVNAPRIGGIIRFTRFLLFFTLAAEGIGALLLFPVFVGKFGPGGGMVKAVFHSISAFCNAGFDTLDQKGTFASLTAYSGNVLLNIVIMLLIIAGGLGFFTWKDLTGKNFRWKRLSLQTKLILTATAVLIFLPSILFFFFEFQEENLKDRILLSLFQSVTTRTAGFNTAAIAEMKESGLMVMILLMLIGGSPGSTAGGMKTTTGAVLMIAVLSHIRHKKSTGAFDRAFPSLVIADAFTLLFLYMSLFLVGSLCICTIEGLPVLDCMFECASALGTVGLTTGITPSLSPVSRLILIFFMYFGRVGGLTLAYAALRPEKSEPGKLPEEAVMIG